jgi:hypothetical protein
MVAMPVYAGPAESATYSAQPLFGIGMAVVCCVRAAPVSCVPALHSMLGQRIFEADTPCWVKGGGARSDTTSSGSSAGGVPTEMWPDLQETIAERGCVSEEHVDP